MTASSKRKPGSEINLFGELAVSLRGMVSEDEFYKVVAKLAHNKRVLGNVVDLVMGRSAHFITVDYSSSLREMVEAGSYRTVPDKIFDSDVVEGEDPGDCQGKKKVQARLIHFDENLNSGEVIKQLNEMSFRPATIAELLAFGAKYPEVQKEFRVVALGTVLQVPSAGCMVADLHWDGSYRVLGFTWYGLVWHGDRHRFLAVRKDS